MEYPIFGPTGCYVGNHVWQWTSSTAQTDSTPSPFHTCQCGKYKWEDAQRIRETVLPVAAKPEQKESS